MSTDTAQAQDEFDWFLGIDWGTATHAIDLSDAQGRSYGARTIEHSRAGLAQMVDWLAAVTAQQLARVAVAIEVPRGAVVELLLERNVAVFSLNPKQLDRFRDRFSVAGAKDDRLDAKVLGSALRTDRTHFRRLTRDEPLVIQLRELTRAAEVVQQDRQALTNRLRELVQRICPAWLTLSPNADDAWFWTLLEDGALRVGARPYARAKIDQLLTQHRIRRVTVDEVATVLRTPRLVVATGTVEAVTAHIHLLLPRLRLLETQHRACAKALKDAIQAVSDDETAPPPDKATDAPAGPADPGDVAILQSVPGVGTGVTAAFLADARAVLRTRDYAVLRALSGVAPIRRQTGKQKHGLITMRYACNQRLRNACYHWARCSTQVDAAARAYYAELRARGHSHGRALRSVADRWLRILTAMLKVRTLYDPARFAAPIAVPSAPGA